MKTIVTTAVVTIALALAVALGSERAANDKEVALLKVNNESLTLQLEEATRINQEAISSIRDLTTANSDLFGSIRDLTTANSDLVGSNSVLHTNTVEGYKKLGALEKDRMRLIVANNILESRIKDTQAELDNDLTVKVGKTFSAWFDTVGEFANKQIYSAKGQYEKIKTKFASSEEIH